MRSNIPIKRLFRLALFSSTAIGIITMGPVYMVMFSIVPINLSHIFLLKLIGLAVIGVTFLIFIFWTINILLSYLIKKFPDTPRNRVARYFWSYVICFFFFITTRYIITEYLLSPELIRQLIDWKMKMFGVRSEGSFGLLPYHIKGLVSYLAVSIIVISINTVILIILGLALLLERKTVIESENTLLKIKNIEATNQQLRQQLQPHFLFNSLNILKTLIRKSPDDAEIYIKRLSDLLRSSISTDRMNLVNLGEELTLSINYLEMQKIRFGKAIQFIIDIPDKNCKGKIPIFSIQSLLENAIKHNGLTEELPLFINITVQDSWLIVKNNVHPKSTTEHSTGLGLSNLAERYKIISGDDIRINSDDDQFSVSIKILPDEDSDHRG